MASDSDRLVRRLRKKLRQIENLEILRRDLNEEERAKVDKKNEIRLQLSNLLRDLSSHNSPEEVDGFTLLNASEIQSDEMKRMTFILTEHCFGPLTIMVGCINCSCWSSRTPQK